MGSLCWQRKCRAEIGDTHAFDQQTVAGYGNAKTTVQEMVAAFVAAFSA